MKKFGWINPIKIKQDKKSGLITIKRAGWSVTLSPSDIRGVRMERRTFRGHTLCIDTHAKTKYYRQSKRSVKRAMAYLSELAQ